MKTRIKIAQRILAAAGLYDGKIDGLHGPKTMAGLRAFPDMPPHFSKARMVVASIQLGVKKAGFSPGPIDGYWGPSTEEAVAQWQYFLEHGEKESTWRPEDRSPSNPNQWPAAYSDEFYRRYGSVDQVPLVRLQFPYPMRIAWNLRQKVNSTLCHEQVADSAARVFNRVLDHYGEVTIVDLHLDLFGGCYNKRPIRGGNRWSLHSWGIAFDFDPSRNRLRWGRDRAAFAKPEYEAWWQIWEEEGWLSLGRERNFDWMHVQAAKLS